jgi:ATP-binding cassette subfamily F protein 3
VGDKERDIEKQPARTRSELATLDEQLADETLYSDHARKAGLTQLIQVQAERKAEVQTLEWNWLEASEALENAIPPRS